MDDSNSPSGSSNPLGNQVGTRELRFRVWGIDVNGEGEARMYYSGDIRDTDTSRRVMSAWEDEDLSELNPWMQFTGLQDMNNADVYEGDIVKVDPGIYQVVWGYQQCSFYLGIVAGHSYTALQMYKALDGEVIGNVFENPELTQKA